ncbi:nucleotide-binding universal stress UspA family protein [Bacillus mesophilus]|uniref:Universal stress protein n=1 Tax=Bacillus mesophilus TaxID=1808955 RepID=A0A6M0QA26_9BACI|nr:universal stress protein [Bacillus mesophilus]MBM7662712.1 nucleotide-binding universal stress UspA family protein [Bacillus mesophilus]NEY73226.1 universal stress protein [Bacillus mesophilus]
MINKFSKVLVAYDGSDLSKKAVEYAKNLVQNDEKAELEVVTVMTVSTFIGAYEAYSFMEMRKVAEAAANTRVREGKQLLEGIPNKTGVQILEGDPAMQIIQYAEEKNFDVIVMGSRGLGKVREFFLGSVSHNVVQMAKCPVFIIK